VDELGALSDGAFAVGAVLECEDIAGRGVGPGIAAGRLASGGSIGHDQHFSVECESIGLPTHTQYTEFVQVRALRASFCGR
jgi:hypothetical protein